MDPVRPGLSLSPRLAAEPGLRFLGYLALLPAGALDLEAAVDRAIADNPVLERSPGQHCATCGLYCTGSRCPACSSTARPVDLAAPGDWRADLLRDAGLELPAAVLPLLAAVVDALDDHGFLTDPPAGAGPRDLAAVIAALRAVGPRGIAAGSALDCVRVQATALVAEGTVPQLVADLAGGWLEAVAEGRYDEIADALGVQQAEVAAAVAVLRERTRPFVALEGGAARARPTDVVFTVGRDDCLRVHVAGAEALGVRRAEGALPDDPEARRWWAPYRDDAGRLLAAIEARATMLARVAEILAARQRGFIRHGASHHVPLGRSDVARELSVHPSTVGRAVAHKVARCPDGRTIELADFFGRGTSLRERVREVLAAHPGATDADLAAVLTSAGVPVARRTVAKYRSLTNPASPHG